jgi:transglutaminase-like putative cysteine protease
VTARYRVNHTSRYEYDRAVSASFNEARLSPLETAWQMPLETTLEVEPATWKFHYTDYWGTQVRVFEALTPHGTLDVRATSLVEVDTSRRPAPDVGMEWAGVRTDDVRDRFCEFLTHTPASRPPADLAEIADAIALGRGPHDTALAISAAVHEAMTYDPGSTGVHTLAAEAWAEHRGVCQDYAHLVVGALRHVGLPARYVSGYLHPAEDPQIGVVTSGESHAWVEWWLGEWAAHDPTNSADAGERHVMIGTGRDYSDIPPIKGIVAGTHVVTGLSVSVDLVRLA